MVVALVALLVVDRQVPRWVAAREPSRYEQGPTWRFEQSDQFSVGPTADYLRDRPRGAKPRAMFIGNSVVWGWGVQTAESVPARFQQLVPDYRVLNLAVNGYRTPSMYVFSKAVIDAVDLFVVFEAPGTIDPLMSTMVPVSPDDQRLLSLSDRPMDSVQALAAYLNLYRYGYRVQNAFLGMSTRRFVYINKTRVLSVLSGSPEAGTPPAPLPDAAPVEIDWSATSEPLSAERAASLERAYPVEWAFALALTTHHRRGVFVEYNRARTPEQLRDRADLNARFGPDVRFVRLSVPEELILDDRGHLNALGAAKVARALADVVPGLPARLPVSQ